MNIMLSKCCLSVISASLMVACASTGDVSGEASRAGAGSLGDLKMSWEQVQAEVGEVQVGWLAELGDPVLDKLVAEAQANNRDLQAAAAGVDQARALAQQAGAALTPSVGLSAGGQRGGNVEGSASTATSLGVQLSWEADVWGRVRSGEQAAVASFEAAAADYRFTQYSIAASVARAYLMSIEAQLQENLTDKIVEAMTELNRIVKVQEENGLASQQDVSLAKADLATANDQRISAAAGKRDALRALELLLGRYPGAELEVRDSLPTVPAAPPAGIPSGILERRPDLVAADRRIAAAFNNTDAIKAARLPQIGLSASLGGASNDLSSLLNPANLAWQAAANLVAPLIDGGLGKARVDAANAEQEQAIAAYASAALNAFGEVETALDQGSVLEQRRDALTEAYTESKEALRITEVLFKEGENDLLSVLQVQQRVYGAESNLLSVERSRLSQFVDLNLALGGDWRGVSP